MISACHQQEQARETWVRLPVGEDFLFLSVISLLRPRNFFFWVVACPILAIPAGQMRRSQWVTG
ncbi:hypothetical protein BDV59DRAFT_183560 [Aspergillus ambiguus]|uniref:uncharacterized protein n=1 Tax=Aspergillus ambiguus TaxID=176160 RepID=UPI003CCD00E0